MRIIDISQPLRSRMPVWPGDQALEPRWSARIGGGSSVNVGAVTMSLHSGTHADAPLHVSDRGKPIDRIALDAFIGPALVIEALFTGEIPASVVDRLDFTHTPRVILKTRREPPPEAWTDDFAYLSVDLARRLGAGGASLIGLDTPSVDHSRSKTLEAHHALFEAGVAVLENLRLDHVQAGEYFLMAPPLLLEGMDASPTRAVLLPLNDLQQS